MKDSEVSYREECTLHWLLPVCSKLLDSGIFCWLVVFVNVLPWQHFELEKEKHTQGIGHIGHWHLVGQHHGEGWSDTDIGNPHVANQATMMRVTRFFLLSVDNSSCRIHALFSYCWCWRMAKSLHLCHSGSFMKSVAQCTLYFNELAHDQDSWRMVRWFSWCEFASFLREHWVRSGGNCAVTTEVVLLTSSG